MSQNEMLFIMFSGVFLILALSGFVVWILRGKSTTPRTYSEIDFIGARINAWWAFTIFLALALWIGEVGVILLFAVVSLQCLREYISITKTRISDHHALLWCFYFFLPAQYILLGLHFEALFSVLIPVFAFLLLPIFSVLREDTTAFLSRAAQLQWGLMISVYFLSFVPALMLLQIPKYDGKNALLVLFFILMIQASNGFEYIWNKWMGHHQLLPSVIKSKSIEGLVVGSLCAMVLGAALSWVTPFSIWQAGLLSLLISVVGFAGRLVLAAIKKDRGVKNWSGEQHNESQNGMLDLVDAVSFAAPVFYFMVRLFWT